MEQPKKDCGCKKSVPPAVTNGKQKELLERIRKVKAEKNYKPPYHM